jgi:hypothetical protein
MIWHRCSLKLPSLFGPACCGREATTYDRARKAWLCPEHTKERLCEFCQFERAWVRFCYTEKEVTCEIWLCVECAGLTGRRWGHRINLSLSPVLYLSRVRGKHVPSLCKAAMRQLGRRSV